MWYECSRVILQRLSWNWSSVLSTNIVEVLLWELKYSTHQYSAEPKFNLQHRPKSNIPHHNNKITESSEIAKRILWWCILSLSVTLQPFGIFILHSTLSVVVKYPTLNTMTLEGKFWNTYNCWYVDNITKSKFRLEMFMNFIMTESQKT